jgi:hypothetical protein
MQDRHVQRPMLSTFPTHLGAWRNDSVTCTNRAAFLHAYACTILFLLLLGTEWG